MVSGKVDRMVVCIGASAGGIETTAELIARLPEDFPAPLLVAVHVGRGGSEVLPLIFDRVGKLHAVTPADGETLLDGTIYVAPRGRHLLVESGRARLSDGPLEHAVRPAIDPLFRSAARAYGPRAIGIVLSGMLDDGTAGLREIRETGGWALVQDPEDAQFPSMPASAAAHVDVDACLPVPALADRLIELVRNPTLRGAVAHDPGHESVDGVAPPPGMETDLSCPLCGGELWEAVDAALTTYRCRSGHMFSSDSLLAAQGEDLDTAMWRPIKILRERAALLRRLSTRAEARGRQRSADFFSLQAREAMERAADLQAAGDRRTAARTEPADEPNKASVER